MVGSPPPSPPSPLEEERISQACAEAENAMRQQTDDALEG